MGNQSQRGAKGDRLQRLPACHEGWFQESAPLILLFLFLFSLPSLLPAGAFPRTLEAFPGKTPQIDGKLAPGEWDDATAFTGVLDWVPQFTRTEDPRDLALRGWVKHDDRRLYFAFEVTDDVL